MPTVTTKNWSAEDNTWNGIIQNKLNPKEVMKRGKKKQKQKWQIEKSYKIGNINLTTAIVTLNVNGLSIPIKTDFVRPNYMLFIRNLF